MKLFNKTKQILLVGGILILTAQSMNVLAADGDCRGPRRYGRGRMHGHGPGGPMGPIHELMRMQEYLQLTETQINKIRVVNDKFRATLTNLREQIRPLRRQLHEKIISLKKDSQIGQIESLLKKISIIEVQIRLNMIKHHYVIEKILTPQQRKLLFQERRRYRRYGFR